MLPAEAWTDRALLPDGDFTMGAAQPSLTWRLREGRALGLCDGEDALRQAVALILRTERFSHAVFSHNYGVEFKNLYGLNGELVKARLQSRIEEALLGDDRIAAVGQFSFTPKKGGIEIGFTVRRRETGQETEMTYLFPETAQGERK